MITLLYLTSATSSLLPFHTQHHNSHHFSYGEAGGEDGGSLAAQRQGGGDAAFLDTAWPQLHRRGDPCNQREGEQREEVVDGISHVSGLGHTRRRSPQQQPPQTLSLADALHRQVYRNFQVSYYQKAFKTKTLSHSLSLSRGHKGTIWSLLAHSNWLFSSSSDGTIKVWDIADLRKGCVRTVAAHKDCVSTP